MRDEAEEEFLSPVDLSPPSPGGKQGLRQPPWGWALVACLLLWSAGVFWWFSREPVPEGVEAESPEQVVTPEATATAPPPSATPAEVKTAPVRVEVLSDPVGARVLRNEVYAGETPLILTEAQAGDGLLIQLTGYEPVRLVLEDRDLALGIKVTLPPVLGRIRLQVTPSESTLMLDGQPLTLPAGGLLDLPLRPHELQVSAPGYLMQTHTLIPAKAYERAWQIRLQPLPTPTPVLLPGEEPGSLKTEMVQVQGIELIRPEFPLEATLGSARGQAGRQSNEVAHAVKLTREFRIAKTEISNAQFRKFKAGHDSGRWQGVDLNADALPVVNIRWEDAAAFCNWLSAQEGLPPAYVEKEGVWEFQEKPGTGYRLPTEAEWESVARIERKQALFGWGDKMPPPEGSVNVAGSESRKLQGNTLKDYQDAFAGPAPVGLAGVGPLEIRGLYGNVSEWVQDAFSIPGESRRPLENPLNSAAGKFHVIKGASWRDAGITDLRIARRRYHDQPAVDVGFRVARYVTSAD